MFTSVEVPACNFYRNKESTPTSLKHLTASPSVVIVVVLGAIVPGTAVLVITIRRKLGQYKGRDRGLRELNI